MLLAAGATIAVISVQAPTPAQYVSGPLPPVPTHAAGGGQVILQVSVNRGGIVSAIKVLRSTPPYTDLMMTAVQSWRFRPADQQGPMEAVVLVASVFRPPTINTPTLGSAPADVSSSPREVPFPTRIVAPPYPPQAIDNRVVLVEVHVTANGAVTEAKSVGASSGFDSVAVQAARSWTFRPAEFAGAPISTIAYIVFGFRQPITTD